MGHSNSHLKVQAEATVPVGLLSVDALTISRSSARCWGRGSRRLARFTFQRRGWVSSEGLQMCRAREQQLLPVHRLRQKDGSTAVTLSFSCRGGRVFAATMHLDRLLALLEGAAGGDAALLSLELTVGEDGRTFTAVSCNGWMCSDGGSEWEYGGQGDAERLSHGEGGCGAPAGRLQLGSGEEQQGHAQPEEAAEGQRSPGPEGHREVDDLPGRSGGTLAPSVDDHTLGSPSEVPRAAGGTSSHRPLTAVELWCPKWETPTCVMWPKADAPLPPPSVPTLLSVPQPVMRSPPADVRNITVPRVHCRGPFPDAQDRTPVPEVDLGDLSTLALYRALNTQDPAHYERSTPSSAPAILTVPQPVMKTLPGRAKYVTVTEDYCRVPSFIAQDSPGAETDLGESPSLAHHGALLQSWPEPSVGDPSDSAAASEAVFEWDFSVPAPSAQEESPQGLSRPWVNAILDGLEIVNLVVFSFLLVHTFLW